MPREPFDKPIDKALGDYNLLEVSTLLEGHQIDLLGPRPWRMNLCAASEKDPCTFFVATSNFIHVYKVSNSHSGFNQPWKRLSNPSPPPIGHPELGEDYTINAIKVGRLLEKEVLISVSTCGEVCIWRTEDLDAPPLVVLNHSSTWGLAIHGDQGIVAVSANNWRITVFDVYKLTRANPVFGKRKRSIKPVMDNLEQIDLIGHNNNIPCIDFSESGRYIVSCSIDQTCRIWDLVKKQQVAVHKMSPRYSDGSDAWGWSVKFISQAAFKQAYVRDPQLDQEYLRRLEHGRSTALSSLHLRHSAALPIYRLDSRYANAPVIIGIDPDDVEGDEQDFIFDAMEDGNYTDDAHTEIQSHSEHLGNEFAQLDIEEEQQEQEELERQQEAIGELGESYLEAIAAHGDEFVDGYDDEDDVARYEEQDRWMIPPEHEDENMDDEAETRERNHEVDEEDIEPEEEEGWDSEAAESYDHDADEAHRLAEEAEHEAWLTEQEMSEYERFAEEDRQTAAEETGQENMQWLDQEAAELDTQQQQEQDDGSNRRQQQSGAPSSAWDEPVEGVQEGMPGTWLNKAENLAPWRRSEAEQRRPVENDELLSDWENAVDLDEQELAKYRLKKIPKIIPHEKEEEAMEKMTKRSVWDYIVLTTARNLFVLQATKSMKVVRTEKEILSNIDVRADRLLSSMDRLNMTEWIPELELLVVASQKGMVALMRVLRVELSDGRQTCLLNNEKYLPLSGLQSYPLYGMTVRRAITEPGAPPIYILYLFYIDGTVFGYSISRKRSDIFVELLI